MQWAQGFEADALQLVQNVYNMAREEESGNVDDRRLEEERRRAELVAMGKAWRMGPGPDANLGVRIPARPLKRTRVHVPDMQRRVSASSGEFQ